LEEVLCTGMATPADALFRDNAGGLSPYDVLGEAARILHGIARSKGGGKDATIAKMAELPDVQVDRIADLLKNAGDLAHRAIVAGTEHRAALELLGVLSDRCGRAFVRLGLERRARDVTSPLSEYLRRYDQTNDAAVPEPVERADVSAGTPVIDVELYEPAPASTPLSRNGAGDEVA
jgi:hypothetical protein